MYHNILYLTFNKTLIIVNYKRFASNMIKKNVTISPKIEKYTKDALIAAAKHESRSQANMLSVMILDYCKAHNIKINNERE